MLQILCESTPVILIHQLIREERNPRHYTLSLDANIIVKASDEDFNPVSLTFGPRLELSV